MESVALPFFIFSYLHADEREQQQDVQDDDDGADGPQQDEFEADVDVPAHHPLRGRQPDLHEYREGKLNGEEHLGDHQPVEGVRHEENAKERTDYGYQDARPAVPVFDVVAFPEEGMEALHEIEVENFPAIVAIAHGESIYDK